MIERFIVVDRANYIIVYFKILHRQDKSRFAFPKRS